jgi:hypothetical protein
MLDPNSCYPWTRVHGLVQIRPSFEALRVANTGVLLLRESVAEEAMSWDLPVGAVKVTMARPIR